MRILLLAVLLSLGLASSTHSSTRNDSNWKIGTKKTLPSRNNGNGPKTSQSRRRGENGVNTTRPPVTLKPEFEVNIRLGGLVLKTVKPIATSPSTAKPSVVPSDATHPSTTAKPSGIPSDATHPLTAAASPSAHGTQGAARAPAQNPRQNVQKSTMKLFGFALAHVQQLIANQV